MNILVKGGKTNVIYIWSYPKHTLKINFGIPITILEPERNLRDAYKKTMNSK